MPFGSFIAVHNLEEYLLGEGSGYTKVVLKVICGVVRDVRVSELEFSKTSGLVGFALSSFQS